MVKLIQFWGASIMDMSLQWFVDPWETARNKYIHGHTETATKQNTKLKNQTPDHTITRTFATETPFYA